MKKIKLYFPLTITLILTSVSLATSLQFFKGCVIDGLASLNNQSNIVRDLFILCIMIALEILFAALADYKRDGLLFDGMTDILTEAMSKEKIKAAGFKEQINGWTKLYSIIMRYMLQESVSENGNTEAKAQLMRAVADAVKSDEMDKATMGGIYYQPFSVCAEIPNKKNLHAFTEVKI